MLVSEPEPSLTRGRSGTRSVARSVETDHRHSTTFAISRYAIFLRKKKETFLKRAPHYTLRGLKAQSDACGRIIR
jgi:hypothetical protein